MPKNGARRLSTRTVFEHERRALELIARDVPLVEALTGLCVALEQVLPGTCCAVLLARDDGKQLGSPVGPSLPADYLHAIGSIPVGPRVGSCGTAAYRRDSVIVCNIATDPLWDLYREEALKHGLRACWSMPFFMADGAVAGTFAVYGRRIRRPNAAEIALARATARVAQVAVQQERARRALQASDERFKLLIESLPQIVWEATPESIVTYLSPRWTAYTGSTVADGRGEGWLQAFHPEDLGTAHEAVSLVTESSAPFHYDCRLRGADGQYRWHLVHAMPVHDEAGRVIRWQGTCTDIDGQKRTEQVIERHARQQALLAQFGHTALNLENLDALHEAAADVVAGGLGAEFSAVLLLGTDERSLVLQAGLGWEPQWRGRVVVDALDEPHYRQALRTEGWTINTAESAMLQAHHVRGGIEVPIAGPAGPCGLLGAYSHEERRFAADDAHFLRSLASTLAAAIARRSYESRLAHLAQFDSLTGLPNRGLFRDRLAQALIRVERSGHSLAVVFIDLDRFKTVNDTFGHSTGDEMLVQVAQRLQPCVRSDDTVSRLGGDEFALVLADLAHPDDAALVAQRVLDALAQPIDLGGQQVYTSASLGISVFPSDGTSPEALLRSADAAMYQAKRRGRNVYQFYLPEMNARASERLRLEAQLRGALERGEFVLHYQPKADLESGRISGLEALLRWRHPQRGLVAPLEFISILEETGLITAVGEWVVREVCEQLRRWQAEGVPLRPVAVNVSPRQLQQPDFAEVIAGILAESGVEPALLELELTESMLMSNPGEALRMLVGLKRQGVRLAIDDFGTGYSSLARLKRFPIDALKIDRSFIRDVCRNADGAAIAVAIIRLGQSLGLKVVAEGVETAAQLAFLRKHGCNEMQGYHFARPLEIADCTRFLCDESSASV